MEAKEDNINTLHASRPKALVELGPGTLANNLWAAIALMIFNALSAHDKRAARMSGDVSTHDIDA